MVEEGIRNKWRLLSGYFGVLLVFWLVSIFFWTSWGYNETFITLNQYHFSYLDNASLYFLTHLADGAILPGILLLWMWRKDPSLALTAVIAIFATGIFAQLGKTVLFPDWYRPARVFQDMADVYIVTPNPPATRSFPSGHATSFAAGGLFFAFFLSQWRRWMAVFVGVFTVFLCYTRVTIGVHFPADIFVGSILGSVGGYLLLRYLYPVFQDRLGKRNPERITKLTPYVYGVAAVAVVAQFINLISRI